MELLHINNARARLLQRGRSKMHLKPSQIKNSTIGIFVIAFNSRLEVLLNTLNTGPKPINALTFSSAM